MMDNYPDLHLHTNTNENVYISQVNLGIPSSNQQVPLYNVFSNPELTTSPYHNIGEPGLGLRTTNSPGLESFITPASQPTLLPSYDTSTINQVLTQLIDQHFSLTLCSCSSCQALHPCCPRSLHSRSCSSWRSCGSWGSSPPPA